MTKFSTPALRDTKCVSAFETAKVLFACLMKGENDDHLPLPFTGTVTIELLNQLEDDNHYLADMTFPPDEYARQ